MKKNIFFASLLALIFASCTSMQDVYVNPDEVEKSSDIQKIERQLAFLDAELLEKSGERDFSKSDFNKKVKELSSLAEDALAVPEIQKIQQARLYSLEGIAGVLYGDKSAAADCLERAQKISKFDVKSIALAFRLGKINEPLTDSASAQDKALLLLEKAVDSYKKGDFADSAANFDSAFISLDPFYREAYGKIRDKAWELRNENSDSDLDLLTLKKITLSQMVKIAESQNSSLFFNWTAGKNLSEKDLFGKILAAGLLESKSLASAEKLTGQIPATRILAARFLWNVYISRKPGENPVKYSNLYKSRNTPSPVPDLDVNSPDFDAVLACVEREFLSLPDGINFKGEENISAVEFASSIKKIK